SWVRRRRPNLKRHPACGRRPSWAHAWEMEPEEVNPTKVATGTGLPSTEGPDAAEPEPLTAVDASNLTFDADNQMNSFLFAGVLGHGGFVGDDGEIHLDVLRRQL